MENNKHSNVFKKLLIWLMVLSLVMPVQTPIYAASKLSAPTVSVKNVSSGISVSWKNVSGATGYYVYRKNGDSYKKIKTVTGTSYTDKSVSSGTTYTYKVKAYKGKTTATSSAKKIMRLSAPSFKVANTTSGVKLSWDKVKGAKKYRIYQKNSGKWKKLADVTGTSYTDKTMKSGQKRTYTVKALNGNYASSYNSGKTQIFLDTPKVKFEDRAKGVRIYWESIRYADYNVYRKENGKWVKLGSTEACQYIVTDAVYGKEETYTVKAIYKENSKYVSSYKSFKHTYSYDSKNHTHVWSSDSEEHPTCEKDGYSIQKCIYCGEKRTQIKKATGHNWEYYRVDPTCEEDGYWAQECIDCGEKKIEIEEATGHNWKDYRVDPTCEEDGYWAQECIDCGEKKTEIEEATGHNWKDEVKTCYMCDGCREIWYFGGEDDLEALGFVENHIEYSECPEGGTTYSKVYESVGRQCTNCRKTEKYDSEEHKHIWIETGRENPTCEEDGYSAYECIDCGEKKTEIEKAAGHDWEDDVTPCYMCNGCEEKWYFDKEDDSEALDSAENHIESSKCPEGGTAYISAYESVGRHCTICGKTEKYNSEEHKHLWVEASRENPTCEKDGSVWYECHYCEKRRRAVGETATGHDLEFTSRIEPVCGDDGALIYTCKICGETEKEVIETTGKHEWENIVELHWVEDESYEDGGYYIKIITGVRCTICGKEDEV